MTFQAALGANMVIVAMVFNNTLSSVVPADMPAHAVPIFDFDRNRNVFKIKNSYFDQKSIEVDAQLPVYTAFWRNIQRFRNAAPPNFTDDHFILHECGYCVQFRDISKFYSRIFVSQKKKYI